MVEKIIVSPDSVRGWGNIVMEHTVDDYAPYQSIITEGTDIINGVSSTVFILEGCNVSLVATNPYLLSGETTDLVVSLTDISGLPVEGETVTITDGTSEYTGVTDSNGTYTEEDVSVTGDTTFTAKYKNLTHSCNVLYPCLFVDYGTSTKYNDSWDTWGSYTVTRTRTDSYTLIEPNDRTTASFQIKYINNLTNPQIIEFDCKQVGGATDSTIFQLRGSNQSVIRQIALSSFSNLSLDTWYHWKVDLVNGNFTNVTTNQTVTFNTSGIISFFFSISANATHNLQYSNFVIY